MQRVQIPKLEDAPLETHATLEMVNKRFGFVPNLYRLTALSPKTLAALVGLQAPLLKSLDLKTRERIAIAVSEANQCLYCVAAHTYVGEKFAKDTPKELALARSGRSTDPNVGAVIYFARKVAETRGHVSEELINSVRQAGYSDVQVLEIIGLVIQYSFTNYINNVFDTDIDFPTENLEIPSEE